MPVFLQEPSELVPIFLQEPAELVPIFLQEPVELVPIFLQEPSELVPKEMCVLLLTDPFLFFLLLYVQYLSGNVLAAQKPIVASPL